MAIISSLTHVHILSPFFLIFLLVNILSPPLLLTSYPLSLPFQVQYYGLIKQSTGEDWLNAKMSLSTAQPSLGGAPPTLETHTIRFKTPRYYPRMYRLNPMEDYDRILNSSCYSPTCYEPEQFKAVSKLKDKSEEESLKVETAEVRRQ